MLCADFMMINDIYGRIVFYVKTENLSQKSK